MKKFLALLLAVMMIASMSVTAFAAGSSNINDAAAYPENASKTGVVKVNSSVGQGEDIETVYYIEITWQELNFEFKFDDAEKIVWDPTAHAYVVKDGETTRDLSGEWTKKQIDDAITVKNHSNAGVTVDAAFTNGDSATKNNVTATVAVAAGEESLDNGEGYTYTGADSVVYKVYLGEEAKISDLTTDVPSYIDGFDIDTITVTVTPTPTV